MNYCLQEYKGDSSMLTQCVQGNCIFLIHTAYVRSFQFCKAENRFTLQRLWRVQLDRSNISVL